LVQYTAEDVLALRTLLARTPVTQGEVLWLASFLARLESGLPKTKPTGKAGDAKAESNSE
jgi:hypothetical protein